MATKYAVNPIIVGPLNKQPELTLVPVASSQTYVKGAPFYFSSGQATIVADGKIPNGQFATDVSTAVAANTYVPVYMWNVGTRLEIYVTTTGSASAITYANLGICYDLEVIGTDVSLIAYIDLSDTTDKTFRVLDIASNYEPLTNAAADSPGKCIVEVMKVGE